MLLHGDEISLTLYKSHGNQVDVSLSDSKTGGTLGITNFYVTLFVQIKLGYT